MRVVTLAQVSLMVGGTRAPSRLQASTGRRCRFHMEGPVEAGDHETDKAKEQDLLVEAEAVVQTADL